MATPSKVLTATGHEENAVDVICEGCNKPLSEHTCANGAASGVSPSPVASSRSTGPRKAPQSRPPCPHCGGAIHFSMPGGLQNDECIRRQYYLDQGVIADPYERLPIWDLDSWGEIVAWAKTLKTPITYGRMESAAGGAGTFASIRPKAEPRPKKQQAAAKGERIEDLAATVEPTVAAPTQPSGTGEVVAKRKRGRPRKDSTPTLVATTAQSEPPSSPQPQPDRRARIRGDRAQRPQPTTPPVVDPNVLTPLDQDELRRRQAERRARISAGSAR